MCPMRFFLVFFSLLIAAYFACKALWLDAHEEPHESSNGSDIHVREGVVKRGCSKIVSGLWTLVDMASGRYLWRAATSQEKGTQAKAL